MTAWQRFLEAIERSTATHAVLLQDVVEVSGVLNSLGVHTDPVLPINILLGFNQANRQAKVMSACWGAAETPNTCNMFYLTTHSTHFIYGYMASDIWLRTILIVRKETRCRHIGYSYRLTARVLLYAPSHRQDNTYHGLLHQSWSTGWNEK